MAKHILLLAAALLALTATAAVTGDVNGDGSVNAADVTALYNYILNGDQTYASASDVNGDGSINAGDVTAVYNIILNGSGGSSLDPYNITVTYDGSTATVDVADNISSLVTATVSGAHVSIVADESLQDSVIYTLSGTTADGSFYMDGSYKCYLNLNDLTINNPGGGAITIDNGKRIDITLTGTSTLTDGAAGSQKACFFVNGHSVIDGTGTLNVTGRAKHAFFGDEYVTVNGGTINVLDAAGDGLHVNQYLKINDGTVSINVTGGDGIDVGMTKDETDKNNGEFILNGGNVAVTTTASAVKGVKSESIMTIAGGTLTVATSGNAVYDTEKADISSCAAIKCDSTFNMTAGTLYLASTGTGGKGLNCDGSVNISGGSFTAVTTGAVYEYSSTLDTKCHGIKADGNITLSGGTVLVAASSDSSRAFNSKMSFWTNGGYIMGLGGKSSTVSSGYTQAYKYVRNVSATAGTTLTYYGVSFTIPAIYNNSAALLTVSSPEI